MKEEITPDQLMEPFQGRSLKSILVFTVIVHLVVLVGASIPFLMKSVSGEEQSTGNEKERVEDAVREATASIREIAERHGLKPQDLGDQFASGAPKAPVDKAPVKEDVSEPEEPKSAIEKELETKEAGPELPTFGDEKEDLFK
jgi:transposase-like protein